MGPINLDKCWHTLLIRRQVLIVITWEPNLIRSIILFAVLKGHFGFVFLPLRPPLLLDDHIHRVLLLAVLGRAVRAFPQGRRFVLIGGGAELPGSIFAALVI